MRAQDFSAWLSAIAGMSVEQRRQALQALTKVGKARRAGRFGRAFTGKATRQADGGCAWNDGR